MNFQSRKIGRRRSFFGNFFGNFFRNFFRKDLLQFISKPATVALIGILLLIFFVGYGFWQLIQNLQFTSFFSFFAGIVGKDLEIDRFGNTNILLLGVGGEGHEGADLTDSIQLININHQNKIASIISLPRDLYVESSVGGTRINKLYEIGIEKFKDTEESLHLVRETVADLFDISLPYAFKADFLGFEKAIDELGGVDIFVKETIDDPFYPDNNFGYQPFYFPAGNRHLDGKTALKYVRSRKTSSDFDRGTRQQQVLMALREKAKEENLLSSPRKLKSMYQEIEEHITTNLDLREMVTLGELAANFSKDRIYSWSIHDDPAIMGGFLYTPLRELYGGAFVLLPASDNWSSVAKFFSLIFQAPDVLQQKIPLQILNSTKTPGLAAGAKMILQRFGFRVIRFGNGRSQDVKNTTFFYKTQEPPAVLELLKHIIPAKISADVPGEYRQAPYESDAEVVIEIGDDFLPLFDKLDVFRNVVELKPAEVSPPIAPKTPQ